MSKLGIALYTLREECEKDFEQTLKFVSDLGFEGVEFAGFHNIEAEKLKCILKKYNLTPISSHTSIEDLQNKLDDIINYNKTIDNYRIVCPWFDLKDENSINELVNLFNNIYPKLKQNNIELYYHNHDHEFKKIDDKYILDLLFEKCSYLKLELDTFWAFKGNVDLDYYIKKYNNKMDLIHLKDGDENTTKAIGTGVSPIKDIINFAEKSQVEWIIIENDTPTPNGIEDVTLSIKNYKNYKK